MPKWDVSRLSAGELSVLKRNAGVMMNSASMQAIEAFYRSLTDRCGAYAEKAWFAALCLQCLWRREDHPVVRPFPELLRSMYQNPEATDSTRKRCTNYLDYYWDDDGFLLGKLSGLARKMRAENPGIMPDFEALADDLTNWNHGTRWVQRKWLNIICNNPSEQNKEEGEKENVD